MGPVSVREEGILGFCPALRFGELRVEGAVVVTICGFVQ
jgi:hypothetical protein